MQGSPRAIQGQQIVNNQPEGRPDRKKKLLIWGYKSFGSSVNLQPNRSIDQARNLMLRHSFDNYSKAW